jgi:hypothetical protein
MSVSDDSEHVVTSARDLTRALNRLAGRLEEVRADSEDRDKQLAERDAQLATYGRRNRHLIWITIVSLVLDLLLTAALTVVAIQAHNASSAATSARTSASAVAQSDRDLCLSANASRAEQVSLWNYILSLSPPPTTSTERERVAEFKAHLQQLFAPRDCAHVNPNSP